MSRIGSSSKHAKITIETEDQTFHFTAADWELHLDRPRIDVSDMRSGMSWVPGPTRGHLNFSVTDSSRGGPETTEAGLEVLRRYMKMMGVDG